MADSVARGIGHGYQPAIDAATQIRLLKIFPGAEATKLEGELFSVDRDQQPDYHCLSYVWGTGDATELITISGTPVPIMRNLFAALSHIRSLHHEAVTIWVDSICINQNDDEEKSTQVAMMKDIYQGCSNCFIWLGQMQRRTGNSTSLTDEALADGIVEFLTFLADEDQQDEDLPSSFDQPGALVEVGFALDAMVSCPWWTRVWTLQECVASVKASVLWGPLRMDWQTMLRSSRALIYSPKLKIANEIESSIYAHSNGFKFTAAVAPLHNARLGHEETPMDLLWRHSGRHASNPLDVIYAIMPLMGEGALANVRVDYSMDKSTLYQVVMRDLILHFGNLKPLVGRTEQTFRNPDLPNWAIDWARVRSEDQMEWWTAGYMFEQFDACFGLPPLDRSEVSAVRDGPKLRLRGYHLDTVKIHALPDNHADDPDPENPGPPWRVRPNMARWHRSIKANTLKLLSSMDLVGSAPAEKIEELTQAIDRAVAGRMISEHIEDPGIRGKTMRDAWTQDVEPQKVLFVTETAQFGLGPANLQLGDEIWILCGGRVPFLLRPKAPRTLGNDTYSLIGDVYLEDNMWGESVETHKENICEVVIE
ncbi:heterokaryon incompatibility protein [Colletotrichum musicola]|uniref:Heterokaryon incompatibility protein n=1 Tax=Colletotrichum musicola TaxID=2175873 RepID=A0A8H6JAN9_9PEZI|nr:heterokaryon incompatibility protein [Colletotrichum musicola]